jgi:hypothetical protein
MRCDCGQLKIDGRCPLCDSPALRRPRRRAHQLESKLRRRQLDSERIGLSPSMAIKGFKQFAEKHRIKIPVSQFARKKERA